MQSVKFSINLRSQVFFLLLIFSYLVFLVQVQELLQEISESHLRVFLSVDSFCHPH